MKVKPILLAGEMELGEDRITAGHSLPRVLDADATEGRETDPAHARVYLNN
jgi:hypothetical protein